MKNAFKVVTDNSAILVDSMKQLETETDPEKRQALWETIDRAEKAIYVETYESTELRSAYDLLCDRSKNVHYGDLTNLNRGIKDALDRLIANLTVVNAEYDQLKAQEAYNKAEQDLKDKLTGADDQKIIEAVKGLGKLQEADKALKEHQDEAAKAQAKVDSALKAYEAAKNAVDDVLGQLTTNEGNAIQLETQNKLASMIQLGTLNDIEKIKEDLKNQGIEDTQVNGVLSQLSAALAALENAKAAKDEAEKAKEEADQAVRDAEERRQEIEDSIGGGGTGGDDTGDTDIPDTDVPMVEGPDAGDTDTGVEIEDLEVPLAGVATRGEFLNYLYEHEGAPETELSTFADVPADHPYAKAIGWAQAKGLVVGYGDGNFGPDDPVNYSAVRIILTKYAAYLNIEMPELATLAGEDNSPVFNCTDVLAEFFGE